MTIKVGVIGAGIMGADHARILATSVAGAELVAISDPDAGRRGAVASSYGIAAAYPDPLALIGDSNVDAVIVASPDETHKPLTLACLDAGKPVLCEKPLATSPADCLDIVRREIGDGPPHDPGRLHAPFRSWLCGDEAGAGRSASLARR